VGSIQGSGHGAILVREGRGGAGFEDLVLEAVRQFHGEAVRAECQVDAHNGTVPHRTADTGFRRACATQVGLQKRPEKNDKSSRHEKASDMQKEWERRLDFDAGSSGFSGLGDGLPAFIDGAVAA
jgi:hypothetical protein